MILYFTGTGNSAFIAKRIAEKTGDTAVDVFPMIRENDYGRLSSSRPFVVVCPTYGWQIPHVLGNWLKKTRLSGSRKLYFVMTCGDGIGNALVRLEDAGKLLFGYAVERREVGDAGYLVKVIGDLLPYLT